MKKVILAAVAAVMALVMFVGCSEETGTVSMPTASDLVIVNGVGCADIYAGQNTVAGQVCVTVDNSGAGCVNVTYTTTSGWELVETHLWGDDVWSTLPTNRGGNPQNGLFPYTSGTLPAGTTTWTACIPMATFGLSPSATVCDVAGYFAAHAALVHRTNGIIDNSQTGWAGTNGISGARNWSRWFSVNFTCEDGGRGGDAMCETAFAFGNGQATCFRNLDLDGNGRRDFNRWGWTNGPLAPGSYSFPIYAGAGQCDLSKGVNVGTLNVSYVGATADVTFEMSAGFEMNETHLYVGSAPLAMNSGSYTVAPGQSPYIHDLDGASSDSYTVSGLSGNIYVVAHAVVCSANWPPHEGDGADPYDDSDTN